MPPAAVNRYVPPQTAYNWFIMTISATIMLAFSRRSNFLPHPDSLLYPLTARFPSVFRTCANIQPWVFGIAVGTHCLETVAFHFLRLRKHGVGLFSRVWWLWIASVLLEGLPAFRRIEKVAKAKL